MRPYLAAAAAMVHSPPPPPSHPHHGSPPRAGDAQNFVAHAGYQLRQKVNKFHREGMLKEKVYVMVVYQSEADEIMKAIDNAW